MNSPSPAATSREGSAIDPSRTRTQPVGESLPRPIADLAAFLRDAASLGYQVAFWRSKARSALLRSAADALRSELAAEYLPGESPEFQELLCAYEDLLLRLERVVESVPFRSKVGLLRRNLISTYQLMFILRHLCQAIVCKLRAQHTGRTPSLPGGSLLDSTEKRRVREAFQPLAPGWDKESWDVYDHL